MGLSLGGQVLAAVGSTSDLASAQAAGVATLGAEQSTPPLSGGATQWGLDRLDQRTLPLNNTYDYRDPSAKGVHVYVVDSGINSNDPDFTSRVLLGPNEVTTETPSKADSSDCATANHGTPVAGLIGGDKFGPAKEAVLVSVRAFDCSNRADGDDVVRALQWVIANAVKPAVISFSLNRRCLDGSGEPAPCPADDVAEIIAAEQAAISAGIPVVTGAGDQGIDPCRSPNWAPGAIVVGAATANDERLPTSNFGPCVNMWAPGQDLASDTVDAQGRGSFSGSAFAAAYVTGAVAMMLGDENFVGVLPPQLVAQVAAKLDANSTLGRIAGLPSNSNKMLYIPPTTEGSSIALAKNGSGRLQAIGTDAAGLMVLNTQTVLGGMGWDGWGRPSACACWLSFGADNLGDGRLTFFGLTSDTNSVWQRRQLSLAGTGFTGASQLDGSLRSIAAARERDSQLQLVGVNKDGQIWHAAQTNPTASIDPSVTSAYSAWQQFTGLDNTTLPPFVSVAAEADNNGIVNVFAIDTHGRIWRSRQATVNSAAWFSLVPFAAPPPHDQISSEMLAGEVAVARDGTGRLDVIATSPHGVMHNLQVTPGVDSWTGDWTGMLNFVNNYQHVAAETDANGTIVVFGVDINGDVNETVQSHPGDASYLPPFPITGRRLRS
ncbi:S8 family serine peptidase [Kribbella sp. NBC_00359]|uniref:S8 family serine peptidase n=1 Tax=Kribbella sp. NBC_00359 TaxID=2975966 RepID=UPI002E243B6C